MKAKAKAEPVNALAAIEADATALMAELAQVEQEVGLLQSTIDNTPIGRKLTAAKKVAEALKDQLRQTLEPLKVVSDKPLHTAFGTVGYTKRCSRIYSPMAVRDLAPGIAEQVITETVDAKALTTLVKLGIKHRSLAPDVMQQLDDHVLTETKVSWAFLYQPAAKADQ